MVLRGRCDSAVVETEVEFFGYVESRKRYMGAGNVRHFCGEQQSNSQTGRQTWMAERWRWEGKVR